ncbi:AAA family ATPase [Lactococcus paracarnosus]|uniref:ATP-binding protein n=1 Tax=Pseudolactococcus paracarnosus TaxID=2749962 RepID=A0ABT0APH7_9LACT|nr:AAA family ATPase [Lactococcus paracarnosus]MCJ1978438.1 ATP-binding protein [Lactococcus paracarnosus]MCJ1984583.1 ATP-binding protein [Lactococcus paracarnosus]MCJ1999212.1 ATP-binding protein [Lactococcus paracarnosus]
MKIDINNIGKISSASLDIDGITVVVGENGTGKSTIGKALYSAFNGLSNLPQKVDFDRNVSINNIIKNGLNQNYDFFFHRSYPQIDEVVNDIISSYREDQFSEKFFIGKIKSLIADLEKYEGNTEIFDIQNQDIVIENNLIFEMYTKIKKVLGIPTKDIQEKLLYKEFSNEFGQQIINLSDDTQNSYVELLIKGKKHHFFISNDGVDIESTFTGLQHKSVYIDNPFVLEEGFNARRPIFRNNRVSHQTTLHNLLMNEGDLLVTETILLDEKLKEIAKIFEQVNVGELVKSKQNSLESFGYREGNVDFSLKNVSLGLKTFIILKTLIERGHISERGLIILDEPEIHLHPEWQILFAELIVLLQKQFNLHILLTTHSPYFLEAIEVYSKIHNVYENCNFYLSEEIDKRITVRNINGNLAKVYDKFFLPFQKLEDLGNEFE